LVRELQDFRVEYTAAGHLTFNARSGKHDDLVLTLAIAVWRAHGGGMESSGFFELTRSQSMSPMACLPRYYVGVDLGQSRDPTATGSGARVDPPEPIPDDDFGLKPKANPQPGSLEWFEQQRRQESQPIQWLARLPLWFFYGSVLCPCGTSNERARRRSGALPGNEGSGQVCGANVAVRSKL